MPRRGSELKDFLLRGLEQKLYPNLKWIDEVNLLFAVVIVHQKNRLSTPEDFTLYKDYYLLKNRIGPLPLMSKMRGNFFASMNKKKGKYVRFQYREGNNQVYQFITPSTEYGLYDVSPAGSSQGDDSDVSSRESNSPLSPSFYEDQVLEPLSQQVYGTGRQTSSPHAEGSVVDAAYAHAEIGLLENSGQRVINVMSDEFYQRFILLPVENTPPEADSALVNPSVQTVPMDVENFDNNDILNFFTENKEVDNKPIECREVKEEKVCDNLSLLSGTHDHDYSDSIKDNNIMEKLLFTDEEIDYYSSLVPNVLHEIVECGNGNLPKDENEVVNSPLDEKKNFPDVKNFQKNVDVAVPNQTSNDGEAELVFAVYKVGNEYSCIGHFKSVNDPINIFAQMLGSGST